MLPNRYLSVLTSLALWLMTAAGANAIDFDKQVAPLLAGRCLDCHQGEEPKGGLDLSQKKTALAGGESGAVISPGKLDDSLLWDYVRDDLMPPKKPLTAEEKAILKQWIAAGANWGTDPIDPYQATSKLIAGYDWWSLQPVTRPAPPKVKKSDWPRGEIDSFVLARLEAAGLEPSPEASRRTLIRRLSYDLLGLPPSPDEIESFVDDPAPDAYTRLVDRLLASPHYGERWARHWLDVARFGESDGFEYDRPRANAWPYRDWVIQAFNNDMPYDEFARKQIAGDLLKEEPSVTATGFLVGGAFDGLVPAGNKMKQIMRQDELDDLVAVVSQTFLGLTVNCARCHDHKFDPIRQTDYYRIASALSGVHRGDRKVQETADSAALVARLSSLRKQVSAIEGPIRKQLAAAQAADDQATTAPQPIARWDFDTDLRDSLGELHGEAQGGAKLAEGRLQLDGKTGYVATAPISKDITEKSLSVWIELATTNQRGGGAIALQSANGATFDSIVYAEREPGQWMAGSDHFRRTQSFRAPVETAERLTHFVITYAADGTITAYRDGQPYGSPYRAKSPVNFKAGDAHVLFGMRHGTSPGANRMLAGAIDRAELFDRALTPDEVAALSGLPVVSPEAVWKQLTPDQREQITSQRAEIARLESDLRSVRVETVYAVTPRPAPVVQLLHRGSPFDAREPIAAGGLSAVKGPPDDFGLSPSAPGPERRRKLAQWIASPENPLFARTIANRLWHYHFGAGLVTTPNDLGFSGGPPSHPELLDYLATRLAEQDWSLKRLHREIVLSATYRQAGAYRPAAAKVDADNRLLWRKAPLRLEAEIVRDAILDVAGKLNPQMGGPGFEDYKKYSQKNTWRYDPIDPVGNAFNRRSVYRTWARGGRNPLLDTFDCPDPSTTAPDRGVTTTPLQALVLLNNSFVLRMSDAFAARLQSEAGAAPADQVRRAYQIALGRNASDDEVRQAVPFVRQHGLSAFCRVVFNANEFLYAE